MLSARPVKGFWRSRRSVVNALLIGLLFATPWIEIAGEPLLRLDIPGRKFHVFGLVIFPQELLFLWLIVMGLVLALFFFTALAGRLWCGWGCPQTVFTDLFAGIARFIQGRKPGRTQIAVTHLVWAFFSIVIGFHLVAYFLSPYQMLQDITHLQLSGPGLGFLAFASVLSFADFGFFRQTFCKVLCPYARFQGVMFDRDTLVVAYDGPRGEPRGKRGTTQGDCVDCGLCVAVCPTEIDIREGLQYECIACTQCIDACDGVMAKLDRPEGLIAYRSLAAVGGRAVRLLRPRTAVYGALLVLIVAGFSLRLSQRQPLDLQVARNRSSLYQTMPDGRIGNAYTLHIQNRDRKAHSYQIGLQAPEHFELLAGVNPVPVPATSAVETRVFVVADPSYAHLMSQDISFLLGDRMRRPSIFVFPGSGSGSE